MSVKLRLARAGTHNRAYYWIVAADIHMPRDGRFLEKVGTYNPRTKPSTIALKTDRVMLWLDRGAEPTAAVRELLRGQGLLKIRAEAKKAAKAAAKAAAAPAPAPEA
jgi:small subunit ribosomal protein S16